MKKETRGNGESLAGPNPAVDSYIEANPRWRDEIIVLRSIMGESGLTEDLKWGVPCYTLSGSNVGLIHVFKEYCAILFVKGSLMKDPAGILVQQTENVQAGRQVRFVSADQIREQEPVLREYVQEAIAVEKSGAKVAFKTVSEFTVPGEFQAKLDEVPGLKTAFEALTPGRQKGYCLYFSGAKQASTRAARVEKYLQKILDGKGIDD